MKDAIRRVESDNKQKGKILGYLSDMNHRIPVLGGAAEGALARIEEILSNAAIIETVNEPKVRAADRALNRSAPFHHEGKNSIPVGQAKSPTPGRVKIPHLLSA